MAEILVDLGQGIEGKQPVPPSLVPNWSGAPQSPGTCLWSSSWKRQAGEVTVQDAREDG